MLYCLPCKKSVTCSKTRIKRRAESGVHKENMKSDKARKQLTRLWGTTNESIIELKVCAFITEHDLSLSLSDWMVPLLRSLFPKDPSMGKSLAWKAKGNKHNPAGTCIQVFRTCNIDTTNK